MAHGSSLRTRVEKLEASPRALPTRVLMSSAIEIVREGLREVAQGDDPVARAIAAEIEAAALVKDFLVTDLSEPAIELMLALLVKVVGGRRRRAAG